MYKVIFSLFVSMCITYGFSQTHVDPKLYSHGWSTPKPCVIVFNSESIRVEQSWSKVAKGNYVYQQLVSTSEKEQREVSQFLKSENIQFQSFYIVNAISTKLTESEAMKIIGMKRVKAILSDDDIYAINYIEHDNSVQSRSTEPEWGIKKIGADKVWEKGYKGKGVVIGGLDTGFEWYHGVLKPKYRGYVDDSTAVHMYNWHDGVHTYSPLNGNDTINPCGFSSKIPCDDGSHGTHTMGTMVGSDSTNLIGVAPDAEWVACRNMDRGWGKPSTYLECFEWMLAPRDTSFKNPRPDLAPDVINNSWYCAESEGCDNVNRFLFDDAIKNMKAAGIVVVVSAGNSGTQGCGSIKDTPALFKSSFSVGATDINDLIAGFSSRGPAKIDSMVWLKPNVSAPGVDIRSITKNGSYANYGGTSMSGPHVAGAVALIISANPSLRGRVELIEDILEATATPLTSDIDCDTFPGAKVPNAVFGYGRINVEAAVERALLLSNAIDVNSKVSVDVYPNPASDIVTIDGQESLINGIVIRDLQGKVVRSHSFDSQRQLITLGIVELMQGIYVLEVNTQIGKQFVKLVKK